MELRYESTFIRHEKGNEVLPCTYPNLATHSETAVNFQREKYGKYGIMDFDGNILMDPRYGSIQEYNSEHGLIAAGDEWNKNGVARVNDGKVTIDFKTCTDCLNHHGKVYRIDEYIPQEPPLHPFCRCVIEAMKSVEHGEATRDGENGK